ncbi:MAG: ABC transporter ATP-binding protein [Betaproteobacteria bacterium]|nr:ABC transporter ATP-binding protein [Betaproteobacteria bacterium]
MSAVVSVRGLVKRFGKVLAVDEVSFEIAEREFFSLLGPSGCGKTTTLRCVAGLETADAGTIEIGGRVVYRTAEPLDVPPNERGIGMVFQSYAVWPHMSVFDNVAYPLKVRRTPRTQIAARVAHVLRILGMEGLEQRRPSQLSGGQQQRVALGRALALEPSVLLLDEPLSNLDAKLREQMRAELKLIQRESGLPILYVTHDQVEALAMSDRIAVMCAGRVHQLAPPEAIYRRPATAFVLDFIGGVNYLPCQILSAGNDAVTLRWRGEGTIILERPSYVPDGREVLLAMRPEDLRLVAPDSDGALRGRVVLRSFYGAGFEYRIRLGETELRVATGKDLDLREGSAVGIVVAGGLLLDPDAPSRPEARAC